MIASRYEAAFPRLDMVVFEGAPHPAYLRNRAAADLFTDLVVEVNVVWLKFLPLVIWHSVTALFKADCPLLSCFLPSHRLACVYTCCVVYLPLTPSAPIAACCHCFRCCFSCRHRCRRQSLSGADHRQRLNSIRRTLFASKLELAWKQVSIMWRLSSSKIKKGCRRPHFFISIMAPPPARNCT